MLKRLVAALVTAVLAVGLALGAALPASAHNPYVTPTCAGLDIKMDYYGANTSNTVTVTVDGKVVETIKFGDMLPTRTIKLDKTSAHSYVVEVVAQHTGYDRTVANGKAFTGTWIPCADTGLTCDVSTLYKGSPLSNGDHINMNVTRNGGGTFQVNASVDIAQAQDPKSESGFVVRMKLPTGDVVVPLTKAQVASGILAFEYSKSWSGTWTVQWVQYNSRYFNQDNIRANDLKCGTDTPVTVTAAPSATPPTCTVAGTLVIPTQTGVVFGGATNGSGPGTYTITATAAPGYKLTGTSSWTVTVLGTKDAANCVQATSPTLSVAQCDATSGQLVSAVVTIPSTANLQYSKGGTVYTAGQKVSVAAGTHVFDVVATNGWTNTGPSSFTIVVSSFGCDKAVQPTLTLAQCDVTNNSLTSAKIAIPTTTPGLEYRIAGIRNGDALTGDVPLGPGTYTVTVTAKSGYQNTGASSFTIVVPAAKCEKSVEPALTLAICHAQTGAFQTAYVTIPTTTPGLQYRILGENGGNPVTGRVNLPAGTYTVTVTATSGVTNTGADRYTIVVPELKCVASVEPALTQAQCDATDGTFTPAFVRIPSTPGLEYRIAGIQNGNALSGEVELPEGVHTIVVSETGATKNTGAREFTVTVAKLACAEAVTPTLVVAECDADGKVVSASLLATATPGLTYTIRGGDVLTAGIAKDVAPGTYVIDVTTDAGVTNTGPSSFTIDVSTFDCRKAVEPTLRAAECDALTGPISASLEIPSTTPGLIYTVGGQDYTGGETVQLPAGPYTVDVRAAAGFENTGPDRFTGTVAAVDCDEVEYVAPAVTAQTCDKVLGGTTAGSLLFTLNPDLAYEFDGTPVTTATVANVAPGTYTVKVIPAAGHFVKGGVDTFTVTVPAAKDCDNVYTTPLDPFANPEICDLDGTKLDGSITVVHVAGIQWYLGTKADGSDKIAIGTDATVGAVVYPKAAGDYHLFAEAVDPTITIAPGHDYWAVTVAVPKPGCLPTLGLLEADATASQAVCNPFGDHEGTITVEMTPGVAYAFQDGTPITAATTKVAPGTYTVLATATVPGSTLTASSWVLTVAAPTVLCDLTTLAFTGQNSTGVIVLAILLLQAGLVLVAIRFVRIRRARHLAV